MDVLAEVAGNCWPKCDYLLVNGNSWRGWGEKYFYEACFFGRVEYVPQNVSNQPKNKMPTEIIPWAFFTFVVVPVGFEPTTLSV